MTTKTATPADAAVQLRALGRELRQITIERRRARANPPEQGLVVDVGAGQAPHPSADVVVDKYPVDSFERPGEAAMAFDVPLVVADGEHLPFADGTFVYAIAEHVLEHAQHPDAFARELARVANAGFVQVPSRESELVYGWPYHPWLIDLIDGELVFEPRRDQRAAAGAFMHHEFEDSILHRAAWMARRSRWQHSVRWRENLPVRVAGESRAPQTATFNPEGVAAALRATAVPPLPAPVAAALRCPACRSALSARELSLHCTGCGRRYPVAGNVPLLLEEAADRDVTGAHAEHADGV